MNHLLKACFFYLALGLFALVMAAQPDAVVLKANDIAITVNAIQHALTALPPEGRAAIRADPTKLESLAKELYRQRSIEQQANKAKLENDPQVIQQIQRARLDIFREALMANFIASQTFPDFEELAKERYQTNQRLYVRPRRIQIAQIFIPLNSEDNTAARRKADELYTRLKAGESFEELAREYSSGPNAALGGKFSGWQTPEVVQDNPLLENVFALNEVGKFTEVLESEWGYHILRLLAVEDKKLLPYEQVKGRIINELAKRYEDQLLQEFAQTFEPPQDAQVNRQVLDSLVQPTAESVTETSAEPTDAKSD